MNQGLHLLKMIHLLIGEVFVPPFVDLLSSDVDENIKKLREAGVRYPFGMYAPSFTLAFY